MNINRMNRINIRERDLQALPSSIEVLVLTHMHGEENRDFIVDNLSSRNRWVNICVCCGEYYGFFEFGVNCSVQIAEVDISEEKTLTMIMCRSSLSDPIIPRNETGHQVRKQVMKDLKKQGELD